MLFFRNLWKDWEVVEVKASASYESEPDEVTPKARHITRLDPQPDWFQDLGRSHSERGKPISGPEPEPEQHTKVRRTYPAHSRKSLNGAKTSNSLQEALLSSNFLKHSGTPSNSNVCSCNVTSRDPAAEHYHWPSQLLRASHPPHRIAIVPDFLRFP